jgi:hypothetical protein
MPALNSKWFWITILAIAIFTFGFRVVQIGHGLPDVQIADENSDLSNAARLLKGELPSRMLRYERPIMSNIEVLGFGALYVLNVAKTGNTSFSAFQDLYYAQHGDFVFVSRLLVVLISVGALIALADLIRKVTSPLGGIIAALLMCFYYLLDVHTLYAMPDSLSPSAIIYYLWAVNFVFRKGSRLSYALAGIALAFVMLAKVSSLPIAITLLIAHGFRVWNEGKRERFVQRFLFSDRLYIFAVFVVVGNVMLNPEAFIHLDDLMAEIGGFFRYAGTTYKNPVSSGSALGIYRAKIYTLIFHYMGIPLALTVFGGVVAIIIKRTQAMILVLVAAIAIALELILQVSDRFLASYWTPIFPFFIIMASIGLISLIEFGQSKPRLVYYTALAISGAVILNEAWLTLHVADVMSDQSTYLQAQAYIQQNVPPESAILMGPNIAYSVPLQRNEESIQRARKLGAPELQVWSWWLRQHGETRRYEYNIFGPEFQPEINNYQDVAKLIADNRIQYVIQVDYCGGEIRIDADSPAEFPPINADIKQNLQLVKVFSPFGAGDSSDCKASVYERATLLNRDDVWWFQRPGPIVKLYRYAGQVIQSELGRPNG